MLREHLKQAHELFEATTADVTPEQVHWIPPGVALPLGAVYAHAVCGEDFIANTLLRGEKPLYETTFTGRSGISAPQPYVDQEWARGLRVDLDQARPYARAVFAATDAYLAVLRDEELDRVVDMTHIGWGTAPLHVMLGRYLTSHIDNLTGEISCIKGLQGAKGYPF
jgi:hypothetical protein